jgi:RNA polymerase sigma-70 factor (ECF subfamily)
MMTPATHSDEELLRLMIAGDEEAFTILYNRRQGAVYRFALHMSGSTAIAEDVTQEVFIVLISEAERYDPSRGSLSTYLCGISRNHVLRRMQRDRMFVPIDSDSEHSNAAPAEPVAEADPLGDLTRSETVESVRRAILSLPAHYREVVVLCELNEMDYAEAANVIGCAVGTVRSRLHRGRALLVEKLRASEEIRTVSKEANPARCFA